MAISSTEEILAAYQAGEMVILMDDEDRENEGDLVMAAEHVTAHDINFMATHGRGLICLTLTKSRCQQLRLPLMVTDNKEAQGTAFTMSIEAAQGVTTGISAADRAHTVKTAIASHAVPDDIVMPGHIFPLQAREGGVLTRPGHTEAGCDLARLAGLEPASVIVEIMNEDGTMARLPDLEVFAKKHGLKLGTIADLIKYRIEHEKTVTRVSSCQLPSQWGDFTLLAYEDGLTHQAHFALTFGDIDPSEAVLTRVHMQNTLCDLFHSQREECGWPLSAAMQQIAAHGSGVIVVLRGNHDAANLLNQVEGYRQKDLGLETPAYQPDVDDEKTYGLGAQILKDLGLSQLNVIGSKRDMKALSGFNLEIMDYVEKQA